MPTVLAFLTCQPVSWTSGVREEAGIVMARECQYFFLALLESRKEEFMSRICPPHCPRNRGDLLFFSMVAVSCTQSSQGGSGELRVQSQWCTASAEAGQTGTCMAGAVLEQPALEQAGVSGVCVECCAPGTRVWKSVGLHACGFGCCRRDESSPVWKYSLWRSGAASKLEALVSCRSLVDTWSSPLPSL